ncbi:uncharacterized protein MONBRDRAFT_17453 [Monosiga brevicollis MX1]|uniref:Uncharacterized protein n=1 Tax=Monosiga brevicollis TaxID=81824 RepID=A9URS3_MONBE|nr:uncharacterized protein MONBRDRAFT_17453 [Monosiga brevicollis MX1]EDQ91977.1 predicted protein [Monosiga brevicollis MX1]|eukprot:XP_001743263.1 hypothetical protein [Monosiga brevicollis MX1]
MASNTQTQPISPWIKYSTGALATMTACLVSNPFEVMKTRLQLQGEMKATGAYQRAYRNVFHAFYEVFRTEGIRGVQAGLGMGILYQAAMNGPRLSMYDYFVDRHFEEFKRPMTLPENMLAGATAGALSAFLGSPLFLVKTQQQAQSASGVGFQHSSALQAFRAIIQQEGVLGLWRGIFGSVPRLAVGSMSQLVSYGKAKTFVTEAFPNLQGTPLHFSASMIAGGFVALCMNPFDVIMTRLYNQPVDPSTKQGMYYSGWFDCIKKTAKAEGPFGFYKGVTALYLRIGPHTVLTFVVWEALRNWIGVKEL